jgi:hypothetical protein
LQCVVTGHEYLDDCEQAALGEIGRSKHTRSKAVEQALG